jgi:hypothetical protein
MQMRQDGLEYIEKSVLDKANEICAIGRTIDGESHEEIKVKMKKCMGLYHDN